MVIVMSALRIGVINSETEYRHTLESQRSSRTKKNIMLLWQNIHLIGRQARSFTDQHTRQES